MCKLVVNTPVETCPNGKIGLVEQSMSPFEMDMNEAIIRQIRSYKANRDEYSDVTENCVGTRWYMICIGMS